MFIRYVGHGIGHKMCGVHNDAFEFQANLQTENGGEEDANEGVSVSGITYEDGEVNSDSEDASDGGSDSDDGDDGGHSSHSETGDSEDDAILGPEDGEEDWPEDTWEKFGYDHL
jgi:hypothetical protein